MSGSNLLDLTKVMRGIGAAALLLSGAVFLFQGLSAMDSFYRFLAFTAMTLALGGLGVFCASYLKEPKGARSFLTLATAAVPALFAQVGAMIYYHTAGTNHSLPEMFKLGDVDPARIIVALATVIGVGGAIAALGFAILDRDHRKELSVFFILNSLLLLVPSRSAELLWLAAIVNLGGVFILAAKTQIFSRNQIVLERGLALGLVILPPMILLVRTGFYDQSNVFISAALAWLAIGIKSLDMISERKGFSPVSLALVIISLFLILENSINLSAYHLLIPLFIASAHGLVRGAEALKWKGAAVLYKPLWLAGSVIAIIASLFTFGFPAAFALLVLGALAAIEGYALSDKTVFQLGVVILALATLQSVVIAFDSVESFHWVSLGLFGGGILLAASFIEKANLRAQSLWLKLQYRFK